MNVEINETDIISQLPEYVYSTDCLLPAHDRSGKYISRAQSMASYLDFIAHFHNPCLDLKCSLFQGHIKSIAGSKIPQFRAQFFG
jgi:hypothetical protein